MGKPSASSARSHPKFSVSFGATDVRWLPADSSRGPRVGLVTSLSGAPLLLVAGRCTYDRETDRAQDGAGASLRYTVEEWQAFIGGVTDGEFDDMTRSDDKQILLRDSKDPEGPILVFSPLQMNRFFAAIRSGKYNLV